MICEKECDTTGTSDPISPPTSSEDSSRCCDITTAQTDQAQANVSAEEVPVSTEEKETPKIWFKGWGKAERVKRLYYKPPKARKRVTNTKKKPE